MRTDGEEKERRKKTHIVNDDIMMMSQGKAKKGSNYTDMRTRLMVKFRYLLLSNAEVKDTAAV